MPNLNIIFQLLLAVLLTFPGLPSSGGPWDKPPDKWDEADAFRILRNSPWSPTKTKLAANRTKRDSDPLSSTRSDNGSKPADTTFGRDLELSHNTNFPDVTVLWWSSKTIRLAQLRLRQLKNPAAAKEMLKVEDLPDYVIAIEGSDPFRVLSEARESLHDTVFLELADGVPLDFQGVNFVDATGDEEARVEFHFRRQIEDRPAIDPESARVIFHCKATAKTERLGRQNALAFHAEFHPSEMTVRGVPDL